jgi:hypothetical protein
MYIAFLVVSIVNIGAYLHKMWKRIDYGAKDGIYK